MEAEEKNNIDVIYRLTELANNESYDEMNALFCENYIDHNPGWNVKNLDDLKKIIADGHKNFDVKNEIKEVIASGDKVFVHVNNKGRHLTKMFGVEPTGKETNMTTFEIYRFEGGKIAERWVVSDMIGLLKQIGVKISVLD